MAYRGMGGLGNRWRYWGLALELGCCARYSTHNVCGSDWCVVLCRVSVSLVKLHSPPHFPLFFFQRKSTATASNGHARYSCSHSSFRLSISGVDRPQCAHNGWHTYAHTLDCRLASPAFIFPACPPALASATYDWCQYGSRLSGNRNYVV